MKYTGFLADDNKENNNLIFKVSTTRTNTLLNWICITFFKQKNGGFEILVCDSVSHEKKEKIFEIYKETTFSTMALIKLLFLLKFELKLVVSFADNIHR